MKSVITPQEYFSHVARPEIQRSTFDRSHGLKTAFNAGYLIPIFWDEALPGDTFNMKANLFGRLSTLQKPIMDNIYIDVHFWSVPMRLLWENWQKFNGEQINPGDPTDFIMPTITSPPSTGFTEASLHDYFGLPTKVPGYECRTDPLRAYAKVWNEWYRDQNLQDSAYCPIDDGPDTVANQTLLRRGKRKDYYTGALPFAQKGDPVTIPLGDQAPLVGTSVITRKTSAIGWKAYDASTNTPAANASSMQIESATINRAGVAALSLDPMGGLLSDLSASGLYANLSAATAVTINALREAVQVQRMLEKDARGGTRYTELIRAHFGVVSPDARLQRPEYLGGGTVNLNVNPIAQTSASLTDETPQANLAAMGTFSAHNKGFMKSFTEHEIILGVVSARADYNYQQGLFRPWSRSTRYDFFWPTLAHLGEQAILCKEVLVKGTANPTLDETVFAYQERYAEYRYKPSLVTAVFRSNAAQSLDVWHLAQEFSNVAPLSESFIWEAPPISRVVAIAEEEQPAFLLDCYFDLKCTRPMPTYATPGLMDHF